MKENNMHLISRLFKNETIRTIWSSEEEKYYVSIVDIVGVLSESTNPRKCWNWLKNKIQQEDNFELSSITRQLKLKSADGKYRITDVWYENGITEQSQFAILTDEIYKTWSDMTAI